MSSTLRSVAALVFLLACGRLAVSQESQDAALPDAAPELRWSGERAQDLQPSGRRLFAGALQAGLGFRGALGYGDLSQGFRDPLLLELWSEGRALALERTLVEGFASHQLVKWQAAGLELLERKYITDDDELVDELELLNSSDAALDLELLLSGAATPQLVRAQSEFLPVSLAQVANLPAELEQQFALAPESSAGMSYDGVGFQFARMQAGARPAFLCLRGGDPGSETRELPAQATLDLPEVAAIATLHLLCAALAPAGRVAEASPASYVFHFDDGTSETLAWPSIAARLAGQPTSSWSSERHEWHLLLLPATSQPALRLAYLPPPGRFLRRLELRKGAGSELPCLLAATLELPPGDGRPAAHCGVTQFVGSPVYLALAGEDFVPVRAADGRRVLLRSVHLEPRATLRMRTVLCTGPREMMTVLRALDRVRDDETFSRHRATRASWFEEFVPEFECSDASLELVWDYRWQLVRRSMLRLDLPEFSLPIFYRGLAEGEDWLSLESSGRILSELRWMRDLRFAQGQLRALCKAQRPGARLTSLGLSGRGSPQPHRIASAALGVYEASASRQFLAEVWPSLVADFDATWSLDEAARLPENFARHEQSARALALGAKWLGDVQTEARLRAWSGSRRALDASPVERSLQGDSSPAPTPRGSALDVESLELLARRARDAEADSHDRQQLARALADYARAQLFAEGPGVPLQAIEGSPAPAPGDVFDSRYADLIVRWVAGLVPAAGDELELWPLITDLDHFRLRGLVYHGHDLEVIWDRPDGELVYSGEPEGFSAKIDGRRVFLRERLERVRGIPLVVD